MLIYRNDLGIIGNIKAIIKTLNITSDETINNKASYDVDKAETDKEILDIEANMVEAVIDEFYSVIGEEREDYDV